ncbi:unnamed protein product, partial [Trichobilharzia regenti]
QKEVSLKLSNVTHSVTDNAVHEKGYFYGQLQTVMDNIPSDIKILIGDMNAKLGAHNTEIELIMGQEALIRGYVLLKPYVPVVTQGNNNNNNKINSCRTNLCFV